MLTLEVVSESDMVLLSLTQQGEGRVWRLVKANIIDTVRSLVVHSDDVLAHDFIDNFFLEVATSRLIRLFNHSNLVENCLVSINNLMH